MNNDFLDQLNPEQQEAVKTIKGPLLVLAGAGTGKTKVITCRIAYMINSGIAPETILGMTFTNKAAREMKDRLTQLISREQAAKVMLGTFHSFCVKLLRQEIAVLNFSRNFTITDETDQKSLIKQACGELGYGNLIDLKAAGNFISTWKNKLIAPPTALNAADGEYEARMAHLYAKYQELLENQNTIDFDDMLFFVNRIFTEFPNILEKYRQRYEYVLVDEYQDTNDAQFRLLQIITDKSRNLCVVGDDDQSIYGWRGANVRNILDFPSLFVNTRQIKLEQNYRSTNNILNAANRVIAWNRGRYDKNLWSCKGAGEKIKVVTTANAEREADFIADFIKQEMSEHQHLKYSDFAILYRSNHLSRELERSMRLAQLPYRMVGGQEFFSRKEIKDAVAYLKLLVNPKDDQSLLRILGVPPRGIGTKSIDKLKELRQTLHIPYAELLNNPAFLETVPHAAATAAKELYECFKKYRDRFSAPGNLAGKVKDYLLENGYLNGLQKTYKDIQDARKRQDNVGEFINAVAQFEEKNTGQPTLSDYLESYALLEENDKTEDTGDGNSITLTTIHAAKGLEFPYIFLVAMEKGLFPHEMAEAEGRQEEEMRLFYVALTRAKEYLLITMAAIRKYRGIDMTQLPSAFLEKLPDALIERKNEGSFFAPADTESLNKSFEAIFATLKARRK